MSKVFDFSIVGLNEAEGMAFQAMLVDNLSPGSIIAITSEGVVFGWNDQLQPMFGWTRREMLGRTLRSVMSAEDFKRHNAAMQRHAETGVGPIIGKRVEVTAIRKNGQSFPMELLISSVVWHKETYFLARVRDVSDRAEFERQLLALTGNKPLEKFDRVHFRSPEDQMAMETKTAAFQVVRDAVDKAREILDGQFTPAERVVRLEKLLGGQNVTLTLSLAMLRSP